MVVGRAKHPFCALPQLLPGFKLSVCLSVRFPLPALAPPCEERALAAPWGPPGVSGSPRRLRAARPLAARRGPPRPAIVSGRARCCREKPAGRPGPAAQSSGELVSLILSGWIRLAEIGCANARLGWRLMAEAQAPCGWRELCREPAFSSRRGDTQLTSNTPPGAVVCGAPGAPESPRAPGRPPPLGVLLGLRNAECRAPPHQTRVRCSTRVQGTPVLGAASSPVTRRGVRQDGRMHVPFGLALAHFPIGSTEATRGAHMAMSALVAQRFRGCPFPSSQRPWALALWGPRTLRQPELST